GGGLVAGQPGEETELHQFGGPRVGGGQLVDEFVQFEQVVIVVAGDEVFVEVDADAAAAALEAALAAGALDEDAAHRLGGGGEEVPAVGPVGRPVGVHQPDERLVDQGGRLERVAGLLAGEVGGCQAAQLVVNEREQLPLRGRVAAGDL